MNNKSPSLSMSTIISSDAPLLSPLAEAAPWDSLYSPANESTFSHYYIPTSPSSSGSTSPISTTKMLKMRMSPDSASESEQQLCLPTHQVFDFPEQQVSAPTTNQRQERLSISINPSVVSSSTASKRSASPTPAPSKKRATGERINSKDFIPPDVSGLSKREARLVKNRAAAFLSRQRKREEFECMEVRVAELEQENARLLALTQNGSVTPPVESKDSELVSEVEKLRAQLEAAKERERQLAAELISKTHIESAPVHPVVKVEESVDLQLPFASNPRASPPPSKSGASLGLMVLLCALPTLLSMPMNSAVPKSFALPDTPLPAAPSTFDFNSFVPNDYDWSRNTLMDLDNVDMSSALSAAPTSRKLEFSTSGTSLDADNGLDGLDISFDTVPTDNGKIRVRIHPSSSASSRAASPGVSDSRSDVSTSWNTEAEPAVEVSFSPQSYSSSSSLSSLSSSSLASLSSSSSSSYLSPSSPAGDPFLGVGALNDYSMSYPSQVSDMFGQMDDSLSGAGDFGQDMGYGSEYSVGDSGAKRRVRIALKSLPAVGGEGGEWEVQIC